MAFATFSAIILLLNIHLIVCDENNYYKARIESCPGCSLNRLQEVKKFIFDDVPRYENVEFKKIHGAPPELVLLNEVEEEVDRIPLSELNREQCNQLLLGKGFKLKELKYAKARVESCPSCSLNRLPEVKAFIYDDLPSYNIEFKKIHGAPPELVLLNEADEEVERLPLRDLNRKECNDLLVSKGFKPKSKSDEL